METLTAERAIDEMVRRIVERFDPERTILFGSHAREGQGPTTTSIFSSSCRSRGRSASASSRSVSLSTISPSRRT